MLEMIKSLMPNVVSQYPELIKATGETIYMVLVSGLISALIGIPIGIILVVTKEGQVLENKIVNNVLGKIINVFRSIPFIILLAAILPFTRFVVGTTIGTKGAIVPLIFGCVPFLARQIESALLDVDGGLIEAAESMGSSPFEIITRVLLVEGLPGIIYALTITTISLIGLSAMAGTVGGGGLGDFAIRFGYQYFETDITVATIIVLLIIVCLVQGLGEFLIKKLSH